MFYSDCSSVIPFQMGAPRNSTVGRQGLLYYASMPKARILPVVEELERITEATILNKAFQLAYSIYRYRESDREIALKILWEALRSVEVRLLAQHEADRHQPQRPTKVRWNTVQWLQLLIYHKSERYEREQETHQPLREEDMIVRYIKHLLLMTSRRNSFHISLGISRLLYDYTAAETMAIYDLIFQDPDSSTKKADAYYRARKTKLMEEIETRFRGYLRVGHGVRGEKRFQSESTSTQLFNLVKQSLTIFTPWQTECELPQQLDTWTSVTSLQSSQTNQIHSLIHPSCFSKITDALKLPAPETRLRLPRFFLNDERGNQPLPPANNSFSTDLNEEEISTLREKIADESNLRARFVPHSLRVLADGILRAKLDLLKSSSVRFTVEDSVTLVELLGDTESGEMILASHFMSPGEYPLDAAQPETYSIALEGGQKVSFIIAKDALNPTSYLLEIRYKEALPMRAAALWWRRLESRFFDQQRTTKRRLVPAWSSQVAVALLALSGAAAIYYFASGSGSGEPQIAQQLAPVAGVLETKDPSSKPVAELPNNSLSRKMNSTGGRRNSSDTADRGKSTVTTRDQTAIASRSLLSVKRIHIQTLGTGPFGQSVQQTLAAQLHALNRFVITSADEADSAITGSAQSVANDPNIGRVYIELVNVSGQVIWRSRKHTGTADRVSTRVVGDLVDALRTESLRLGR